MRPLYVKVHANDNVAIIANPEGLPAGTEFSYGLKLVEAIPQSHKVALQSIGQGEAIVRYLQAVRPRSSYREIFLRLRAPIRPLSSSSAIWRIVAKRARSLNPPVVPHGAHALRHACATHLLEQGLSLKEIGDHLGHRALNSTAVYASVNLPELRKVANLSLGGLL